MTTPNVITEEEFINRLCDATELECCDESCGCDCEDDEGKPCNLLYRRWDGKAAPWLPGWMNGVGYCEVYDGLKKLAETSIEAKSALEQVGLLPEPKVI
jgi:hypothetical protein